MADQQNVVGSSENSGTVRPSAQENTNNNSTSSYSAYLAWSQYWQYYYMYNFYYYNSFYYNALSHQGLQHGQIPNGQSSGAFVEDNAGGNNTWMPQVQQGLVNGGAPGLINARRTQEGNRSEIQYEFTISSLRKRAFAEFIDFVFLFFLKYSFYSLYFKNADKLSQMQYSNIILIVDETRNFKEIEDLFVQALIYRLMVFIYEAFFIAVPLLCSFGGATPGKYMMGITVISYHGLTPVQGQHLRHFSGTASRRLHPWNACVRAVLKNFMITFLFPIMLSAMFVRDFRTPYDLLANSIVVDANPKRQRQT